MRRVVVALAIGALFTAGCGTKSKQHRAGDAAPVEVVTGPSLPDSNLGGGSTDEVEPNDGADVATPLPLGSIVRGKIEPDSDVDQFRIEITQAGALQLELTAPDGVDLSLELEDSGGTVLAKSDRGAVRVKEGLPNVGVTPGRYLAIVRGKKIVAVVKKPPKGKKSAAPPDAPVATPAPAYEITAQVSPVIGNAEREPDDDRGTANDLIVGDPASGFLGWTGDADVWKLSVETLSAKNAIDLEISAVEGVALSVEVVDGVGHSLVTRKAPRGAPLALRGLVPVVPAGAPPFHYVTIRGDRSNPETPYQLKIAARVPGPDAEIEPDDAVDKAMPVPAERTVVNASWSPGDVDCFALAPDPAPRTVDAAITPAGESDLAGELFVDGKSVAKANHGGKGAAERVVGSVPAGAAAVICVRGADTSAEGTYEVRFAEGPAGAP